MVSGEEHSSRLSSAKKGLGVCLISHNSQFHGDQKNVGAGGVSDPSVTTEGPHEYRCNWDTLAQVKLGKSFIHHLTGLADY